MVYLILTNSSAFPPPTPLSHRVGEGPGVRAEHDIKRTLQGTPL